MSTGTMIKIIVTASQIKHDALSNLMLGKECQGLITESFVKKYNEITEVEGLPLEKWKTF